VVGHPFDEISCYVGEGVAVPFRLGLLNDFESDVVR
jgi:hypothetical protein